MNSKVVESIPYFIEIIQKGSITQAALNLNIDPATVKKRLTTLESYLEQRLIILSSKGCIPTDFGWQLYNKVLPSLNDIVHNVFRAQSGNSPLLNKGKVRILSTIQGAIFISKYVLPSMQNKLNSTIELQTMSSVYSKKYGAHFKSIIENYDILLIDPEVLYLIHPDEWLLGYRHQTDYLKLYAHKDYINKYGDIRSIKDLKEVNFIAREDEICSKGVLELLDESNNKIITSLNLNSVVDLELLKYQQILSGHGVGLLIPNFQEYIPNAYKQSIVNILPQYHSNNNLDTLILKRQGAHKDCDAVMQQIRILLEHNKKEFNTLY